METQVYKVRDPSGALREIRGPVGASDDMVIAKAKELFGAPAEPQAQKKMGIMDILSAPFEMGANLAQKPRAEQAAFITPTVEALGAGGGAMLGSAGGPAGTVAGAGLGYSAAKELMRHVSGEATPETMTQAGTRQVKNALEGATMEAGGRVVGQGLGYIGGKIADLRQLPQQKAAEIARNALGPDLAAVKNALAQAPADVTAGQATADIMSPTWQALMDRAIKRDPRFLGALKESQGEVSVNALAKLAGGTTATEVRSTAANTKNNINKVLEPVKESALKRAALGETTAQYANDAERLAAEAAQKVQDVRRFEAAKPRAGEVADKAFRTDFIEKGYPVGATKITYIGQDLPKLAERASAEAASGSLQAGAEARFNQLASDALRNSGIKPLETSSLVGSLSNITKNPSFAGNDIVDGAVKNVIKDISQWTKGGIIDPVALDAVRKNSVNAAIEQLRPGVDASTQKNLAASVLDKVRPAIIDAIENAGGTGYREYLTNYSKAMQGIAEKKLGGEALKLFKTNPDAYVKLVQGDTPEAVEKILGPGKYDIAKEVSDNMMSTLREQAAKVVRDAKVKSQAQGEEFGGQAALKELLLQQISKVRIPSYLSAVTTTTNEALSLLQDRIGKKTMDVLTKASQTPQGAKELLDTLPGAERNRVLQLLSNPQDWKPGAGAIATNALRPDQKPVNKNALRVE